MFKRLALTLALLLPSNSSALSVQSATKAAGTTLHHLVAEGIPVRAGLEKVYAALLPEDYIARVSGKYGIVGEVSPEIKEEIGSILKELGMDPATVNIYATDPAQARMMGLYIPFAALANAFLVDPNLFNELSHEERRAIIGHEAMHIKNNDIIKMGLAYLAAPLLTHFGVKRYTALTQRAFEALAVPKTGLGAIAHTLFAAHQYLMGTAYGKCSISCYLGNWYMRRCEKRADLESATKLNCAEGAAQFMERFRKANLQLKEQPPVTYALAFMQGAIDSNGNNRIDKIHPPLTERIAYLRELAKLQGELPQAAPAA